MYKGHQSKRGYSISLRAKQCRNAQARDRQDMMEIEIQKRVELRVNQLSDTSVPTPPPMPQ
jgi:hypothetical protein